MTGWECSPEALFRYFWDRTLAARGKRVWGGVASAAGSDARSRDEGDAGAHRGGAATPQTAPRRRNRLRWLAFCSRRLASKKSPLQEDSLASRVAKGQPRHPHPFSSSLLVLRCRHRRFELLDRTHDAAAHDVTHLPKVRDVRRRVGCDQKKVRRLSLFDRPDSFSSPIAIAPPRVEATSTCIGVNPADRIASIST